MTDPYPVGTIAAQGRDLGPFQGTPEQFPPGWELADGATVPPERHDHPRRKGQPWKKPDLRRQIITGNSTHIESQGNDDGKMGSFVAANPKMPGEYPLVKVRNG